MVKIWIECQKCGSLFWVFTSRFYTFYPKNRIDYQICGKCESKYK